MDYKTVIEDLHYIAENCVDDQDVITQVSYCAVEAIEELMTNGRKFDSADLLRISADIIETFEDFLEKRGITIDNPEKEDSEHPATIYGSDFGELQEGIENALYYHRLIS